FRVSGMSATTESPRGPDGGPVRAQAGRTVLARPERPAATSQPSVKEVLGAKVSHQNASTQIPRATDVKLLRAETQKPDPEVNAGKAPKIVPTVTRRVPSGFLEMKPPKREPVVMAQLDATDGAEGSQELSYGVSSSMPVEDIPAMATNPAEQRPQLQEEPSPSHRQVETRLETNVRWPPQLSPEQRGAVRIELEKTARQRLAEHRGSRTGEERK